MLSLYITLHDTGHYSTGHYMALHYAGHYSTGHYMALHDAMHYRVLQGPSFAVHYESGF